MINGGLGANAMSYAVWGIPPRNRPGTWVLTANLNIRIGSFNMPFSALFSEQERSFMQPFNQYGVSPGYKWIRVHAGYRSMAFSPYTLNGMVFLGGGMDLTPGKFRFSCMYGRINRAVKEDTLSNERFIPTFRRNGLGFKIGVGTTKSFIDLIYFQAQDDLNSLPYLPVKTKISPEENKVFGLNFRVGIGKFYWDGDGATSIFTRDTRDSILKLNVNFQPLERLNAWLGHRISTQLGTAFHSAIGAVYQRFQVRLQYKRISSDYRSMGTYYFLTDVENITLSPSFLLLKNKLRLTVSAGYQRDNTSRFKYATTIRQIGAFNLSWTPKANMATEIQVNNFGTTQAPGIAPIEDSLRQYQITRSVFITQRFGKQTSTENSNLFFTTGYQSFTDFNSTSRLFLQNTMFTGSAGYQKSFIQKNVNVGINYMLSKISSEAFTSFQTGPQLNAGKTLFKRKLQLNTGMALVLNWLNGEAGGLNFNLSAGSSLRIDKRQRLQANLFLIRANRFAGSSLKYFEARFNLGYHVSF